MLTARAAAGAAQRQLSGPQIAPTAVDALTPLSQPAAYAPIGLLRTTGTDRAELPTDAIASTPLH